ncbi:MAG: exodeoxyribonuclease VII large subunit [Oscillospiraceae bacterium]|nr:exodeoxyribonuclease VII large subunit [Oscillospiraceae bacterium]
MTTPDFLKPRIISVSQLNYYVKSLLDNDAHLSSVFVTGEISNLTDHYRSGHIYFSLKDNNCVIKAVMFAGNARNLKFKPQEGMKIIARGRVSLYEPSGNYQFYVEDMQPDGIGELTIAFEQLKKKLSEKGIFDQSHKKPIPKFPQTIGVITSPTGAAIQDIKNILHRRFPSADIVLCPVLVQGESASAQLVNAVNIFNEYDCADVIIIGRGGGSIEDLWAFNSEELAYAIYASNIPVISAVGHETDFTICDFVSDLRAPTPSAAAELAVPDKEELIAYYNSQKQYLTSILDNKISKANRVLSEYKLVLNENSPEKQISKYNENLSLFRNRLESIMNEKLNTAFEKIHKNGGKLEALNPVSVLQRGYSVAEKDGKIVSSVNDVKTDDILNITLKDGKIITKVQG